MAPEQANWVRTIRDDQGAATQSLHAIEGLLEKRLAAIDDELANKIHIGECIILGEVDGIPSEFGGYIRNVPGTIRGGSGPSVAVTNEGENIRQDLLTEVDSTVNLTSYLREKDEENRNAIAKINVSDLKRDIGYLQNRCDVLEDEVFVAHDNRLKQLDSRIDKTDESLESLKGNVASANRKISDNATNIANIRTSVSNLDTRVKNIENSIKDLQFNVGKHNDYLKLLYASCIALSEYDFSHSVANNNMRWLDQSTFDRKQQRVLDTKQGLDRNRP